MRSLFHFPLPCTTTLAVTVSYSNRPTAPEMSRRPHPAPMRRQRRSPVLLSAARPLPGRPPCRAPIPASRRRPLPSRPITRVPPRCRPHPLGSPRPHRAHRAPSPASHLPHCVPPSVSPYVATEQIPRSSPPIAPTARRRPRSPLALRRPQGPGWQESHRMHPLLAECAKKAPFLAASARNACFSRSRWQHPRPMHPFPGAIGRLGIHGARILPPRALFRVEEPEITHGAKMLPAPPGLSAAAACGPAERALRHATAACGPAGRALRPAARAWPACRMRPPLSSRLCPPRPAVRPNGLCALLSRFAVRDPPRGPRTDASRHLRAAPIPPAARTHRVQGTSGTTQATQCGHKNRIPK